jgi:hypothetical protein
MIITIIMRIHIYRVTSPSDKERTADKIDSFSWMCPPPAEVHSPTKEISEQVHNLEHQYEAR